VAEKQRSQKPKGRRQIQELRQAHHYQVLDSPQMLGWLVLGWLVLGWLVLGWLVHHPLAAFQKQGG
jgi:hypothetical protein